MVGCRRLVVARRGPVEDEPKFQKYREAVVPFIASFGGKLVAVYGKVEVLEGEHDTRPVVMFEFQKAWMPSSGLEAAPNRNFTCRLASKSIPNTVSH
jgi:hypothetical protein